MRGLHEQHRVSTRRVGSFHISSGDIVAIRENHIPRSQRRLGKVIKLIFGKDEHIRGARQTYSNASKLPLYQLSLFEFYSQSGKYRNLLNAKYNNADI